MVPAFPYPLPRIPTNRPLGSSRQADNMREQLQELRRADYLLHYQFIEKMRQEGLDRGGMWNEMYGKGVELESLQGLPSVRVSHPEALSLLS